VQNFDSIKLIFNFFSRFCERWLKKLQKGIPIFSKKTLHGYKKAGFDDDFKIVENLRK
jgi:hypothetical protein